MNSVRPKYKKIVLDEVGVDQLLSYLTIAQYSIAEHAKKDLKDFAKEIVKQLVDQDLKHKRDC